MKLLIDELMGLLIRELETQQTGYGSQEALSMLCRSLQSGDFSWDELRSADPRAPEVIMFWLAGPGGWQNTPTIGDLIRRGLIEIDDLQECRTDVLSKVGRERFEKALNQLQAIADMTRNEC